MRKLGMVLAMVVLIAVIPAMADQGEKIIRFGAAFSIPTGDLTRTYDADPLFTKLTMEAGSAIGPYVDFEFMLTDRIGIDATVLFTDHDFDYSYLQTYDGEVLEDQHYQVGTVSSLPLLISGHFHIVQTNDTDWYFGPTAGYIFYGDVEYLPEYLGSVIPLENDFCYGLVAGLDKPLGAGSWIFSTAIRYVLSDAQIEVGNREKIGFDPLISHAGFGKRW